MVDTVHGPPNPPILGDLERYGFFEMSNCPHSRSSGLATGGGGQGIFYFRFSIFVLGLGFRPPGEKIKNEEGRTKNEKRLLTWSVGAESFLFSFFYFRSWPCFPSPRGEREKKEERRRKKEDCLVKLSSIGKCHKNCYEFISFCDEAV
jgi:hypothetical protein